MKPLKAHWPLSDGAPTTVLHLGATPSTSDVRQMTASVALQRSHQVVAAKRLGATARNPH
jgi:hypothetical protein